MGHEEEHRSTGRQEAHDAFWHLDEELGELELTERPGGSELYTARLKAHSHTSPYFASRELYPLSRDGTEYEITGRVYVLVPDLTLTLALYPHVQPSGAIGDVTGSAWTGMRHHEIAAVRSLLYQEDQALAIWEVDAWGRLDEFTHGRLWQLFEAWMTRRFPAATRIFSDDAEPFEATRRNQEFLAALGYEPVPGTHRIVAKEVTNL